MPLFRRMLEGPTRRLRLHLGLRPRPDLDEPVEGVPPVLAAVLAQRCEIVLLLLERGARPDASGPTRWGEIGAVEACCELDGHASLTCLSHLLHFGARAGAAREGSEPPLARLCSRARPHKEMLLKALALVGSGADPRSRSLDGAPIALLAARSGDAGAALALIGAGANSLEADAGGACAAAVLESLGRGAEAERFRARDEAALVGEAAPSAGAEPRRGRGRL